MYEMEKPYLELLLPQYDFSSEKAKADQDVWDREAHSATTAPTIQASEAKKQNQVKMYEMEMPYLQLLRPRYNFDKQKCERWNGNIEFINHLS